MTEEAQVNDPHIVREVHIGDAVFALTDRNAIFRNGRQMVIPHVGVDFLPELMAALTTEDFVSGIVENANRNKPAYVPDCPAYNDSLSLRCEKPSGHDGPHSGFMGGPADWGGGDDIEWHDHPVENPVTTGIQGTNWNGFEVEPTEGRAANVRHMNADESHNFVDLADANETLRDEGGAYIILCAEAYVAWHESNWPSPAGEAPEWHSWTRGAILRNSEGLIGIVAGPSPTNLVVVDQEGKVLSIEERNNALLSEWKEN